MSEPYSRAFSMVNDLQCSKCGREPDRGQPHLSFSDKENLIFEADYECECGVGYSIEIEKDAKGMKGRIKRLDTGNTRRIATAKSKLHRQTHPAREQVDALYELQNVLDMLRVNWARVEYLGENRPDYPGDVPLWNDRRYTAQVFTEIHNYLASAYTFQETFNTVIQKLPTGELIDTKFQEFKQNTRPVIGLRTYVQHEQMFAVQISPDMSADEYRIHFRVKLAEVWTLDSQTTDNNPHGYAESPEEIYADIDGEFIDILSLFESYLEASRELFELVDEFAKEEMGSELDEFIKFATMRPEEGE